MTSFYRVANSTINLEMWIPPDYDTYATYFVKECGSISAPGRFGWFIPLDKAGPIKSFYNPVEEERPDIKSVHWRYLRSLKFVKYFHIDDDIVDELHRRNYTLIPGSNK